jgi:hypothetical protein
LEDDFGRCRDPVPKQGFMATAIDAAELDLTSSIRKNGVRPVTLFRDALVARNTPQGALLDKIAQAVLANICKTRI